MSGHVKCQGNGQSTVKYQSGNTIGIKPGLFGIVLFHAVVDV